MALCVVTVKNAALRLLMVASPAPERARRLHIFSAAQKAMKVQYWIFETLKSSYSFMPTHVKLLKRVALQFYLSSNRSRISVPHLYLFEKSFNPSPLLLGPPLITFSTFLGETCKNLVLWLSYPRHNSKNYLLAVIFIRVFCTFVGWCTVTPNPPHLFRGPAYFILKIFPTPLLIRTPAYSGSKSSFLMASKPCSRAC